MKRYILLGCTKNKRSDEGLLPAIERYDGPNFRVLRRFLRDHPEAARNLSVFVLSAEFGLISGDRPIHDYDHRMTWARAEELRPQVLDALKSQFGHEQPELFILLGAIYLAAVQGIEAIMPPDAKIIQAKGAQGVKARQLKQWLYGTTFDAASAKSQLSSPHIKPSGHATIRSYPISLTPAQILDCGRQALRLGIGQPYNYRSWYVLLDGQKVGPKWLVSQITGIPVSEFVSSEARRVLTNLGVEVHHE
jgi:hypothetical protein